MMPSKLGSSSVEAKPKPPKSQRQRRCFGSTAKRSRSTAVREAALFLAAPFLGAPFVRRAREAAAFRVVRTFGVRVFPPAHRAAVPAAFAVFLTVFLETFLEVLLAVFRVVCLAMLLPPSLPSCRSSPPGALTDARGGRGHLHLVRTIPQ